MLAHIQLVPPKEDWIDAGYFNLGSKEEFRSKYEVPISQGVYVDSDIFLRRYSLKILRVLAKNLEPKVHRAGIQDIVEKKDVLPGKAEFMVCVPLAPLQKEIDPRGESKKFCALIKSCATKDPLGTGNGVSDIGADEEPFQFVERLLQVLLKDVYRPYP
ncbi:hypothetical protein RUND412_007216 [Rhizina undulata]